MKSDLMKKNFIWNMLGSVVNSCTSLFFMIIVTRFNGVNEAGIFTFAFSIACLFQVICTYSGRTFQVTNVDETLRDSDFLYHRLIAGLFMWIIVLMYLVVQNYDLYKNIIILLFIVYRTIEGVADVLYATVQRNEKLYKVGISLFLRGIIGTFVFLLIDYIFNNMVLSIIALNIISIIILLFYDLPNYKKFYVSHSFSFEKVKRIFVTGFFVFLFTFLTQYILNAPKYAIDELLSDNMQTVYGIISMPATVIILCSQFVVQPMLTSITAMIKENRYSDLTSAAFKIAGYVLAIGFVCEIGCYFLGVPVLEFVYGVQLQKYLFPLMTIIAGATLYGIAFSFSTVLTALRKTFVQIIMYGIASVFVLFASKILVADFQILGAAMSYCVTMLLLCILYFVYFIIYIRKLKKES